MVPCGTWILTEKNSFSFHSFILNDANVKSTYGSYLSDSIPSERVIATKKLQNKTANSRPGVKLKAQKRLQK